MCVRLRVQMLLTVRGRTCSAGEPAFNQKRVLSGGQAWASVRVGAPELCAGVFAGGRGKVCWRQARC